MKKIIVLVGIFIGDIMFSQNSKSLYYERMDGMSNSLSNLAYSLAPAFAQNGHNIMQEEANRKLRIINTYGQLQNEKISKIESVYKKIPKSQFKKKINGLYSAHLIGKKKFAFAAEQKLSFEEPVSVNIVDNEIKDIYLYGKEQMKMDLQSIGVDKVVLEEGMAVFYDNKLQEEFTLVLIEPYINKGNNSQAIIPNEVGHIIVWSPKKKYKDKKIYIQELDNEDNLIRQVETKIYYAKNENEIPKEEFVAINSGNKTQFLGKLASRPFGNLNLYPKISWKKGEAPVKDGEIRFVKIKEYYE